MVPVRLLLHCGGRHSHLQINCLESMEIPFTAFVLASSSPIPDEVSAILRKQGWFLTSVTPPGQGEVVMDVLCPSCLEQLLPKEVIEALKEVRKGN